MISFLIYKTHVQHQTHVFEEKSSLLLLVLQEVDKRKTKTQQKFELLLCEFL